MRQLALIPGCPKLTEVGSLLSLASWICGLQQVLSVSAIVFQSAALLTMSVPPLSINDSDLYQRRHLHHHPQPPLPPLPTDSSGEEMGDYAHLEPPQHTVTTTSFSDYSRAAGLPPTGPPPSATATAASAARKYGPRV